MAAVAGQNALLRLCIILLGYVAACYVAGFTLQLLLVVTDDRPLQEWLENWPGLFLSPVVMVPFIAFFAAIPAVFAVAIGEAIPRRDWLFYTLGGMVAGGLICALFMLQAIAASDGTQAAELLLVAIMLCGGAAAGVTYWAVAGRRAGATDSSRVDSGT